MKILIISDSHGNIERLKHVFGFAKSATIDAIIFCGDWDNTESAEVTEGLRVPIYSVLGNADAAHSGEITRVLRDAGVTLEPEILSLGLGGRRIVVSHFPGKLLDYIKSDKYDAAFHGHTHRRKNEVHGKTLVVNPGPLTGPTPSFAVYDTKDNNVEFIDVAV